MTSTKQLLTEESLDQLLPTHELFQILDQRVLLQPVGTVPGPSMRLLTFSVQVNDEWCTLLNEHCTGAYTAPLHLPDSLGHLSHERWLTGPELPTYLGISHRPTDVAVCGHYVYVSMCIGA